MEHYPAMDIHFPPNREDEMYAEMKRRAKSPWALKTTDTFDRNPKDGYFYFHHDGDGNTLSCTVCIRREKPGHWIVENMVPDDGQVSPIPIDQYKTLLNAFDLDIAEPAAELVEGMTANEYSKHELEHLFSPEAVSLLERFCKTSNQADLGRHLSDQEKWIAFLLCAYDDGKEIHCDVFGSCVKNAELWPEEEIPGLVHEYDFALRLLKQSGR